MCVYKVSDKAGEWFKNYYKSMTDVQLWPSVPYLYVPYEVGCMKCVPASLKLTSQITLY